MNHLALIEKTQTLIAAGDIVGAESALVELADAEGDAALMVVLDLLPAKDILAVIREYDNSKESVVNLLITPEQFARAVVIEKLYKDLTRTHLRGMVNAVIFREEADPLMPSRIPASYCPYQPCRLRPTSRHGSSKMMFQTATGWSWHGFCVIKTQTCSLKC